MRHLSHIHAAITLLTAASFALCSCNSKTANISSADDASEINDTLFTALQQEIAQITSDAPCQCGVALIIDDTDTIAVNNSADYPMMSTFKLHQALAACAKLDAAASGLDTMVDIARRELNPDTWSPMLKQYPEGDLRLPVSELLSYLLIDSDNNASNLIFDKIVSPAETESFAASIIPGQEFRIIYTEAEMQRDHPKSYSNRTSPLAYAALVNRVFTDSIITPEKQAFVKQKMAECHTGMERLAAPLASQTGVTFAHRTGSGYINEKGEVTAVNDGGYVTLPSGHCYAIAVFVKDYAGEQTDADKLIARISAAAYNRISTLPARTPQETSTH